MTTLPHVRVGSVLRRAEDGRRYRITAIHKVETQAHTGFSQVIAHEPWPHPLAPHKQRRRKKRRRYFGGPAT
jgi:hypothetical protein